MTKYLLIPETAYSKGYSYILWKLLEQQGILREDCEVLPLLGDAKPEGSYQKIPASQFARALPEFREKLVATPAPIIITLGGTAFRAVTGLGKGWGVTNIAGYIMKPEHCKSVLTTMLVEVSKYKTDNKARGPGKQKGDPRMAMRKVPQPPVFPQNCQYIIPSIDITTVRKLQFKNITQFRAAFSNAQRVLAGEPLIDDNFQWTDGVPKLEEVLNPGVLAYDLESPFGSNDIERASLSTDQGTWSFKWNMDAIRAYRKALSSATQRIAHNQQFDIPILEVHGVEVPAPQFDSMLAAALIEPDLLKGLDSVAPRYLLLNPWKHLSSERGFADPFYSAKDAYVERLLGIALQAKLEELEMDHLFNDIMMPAVPVLMDMQQQGIKIDVKVATKWCEDLSEQLHEHMVKWNELHPGISPTSPHQLKKLLYGEWKLPIQRRKGDGISTDALALRVLKKLAPTRGDELDLLMDIREVGKLLNTYGQTALGKERVHPSYLPASKDTTDSRSGKGLAATGRLACSGPNLQNQPPEARVMYLPDDSSMCFIEFDWSQAELRIAAALSGDEAMMEALQGDIHGRTMELLKCDRTRAKNVIFGSAYGAGPRKLKETLEAVGVETTEKECLELQYSLARAYPKWWAWRNGVAAQAKEQQQLRNPFGRLRRFPHESHVPAAMDFLPQSIVADMMWSVLPDVMQAAEVRTGRLTTVVHDSFLVQLPKAWLQDPKCWKRFLEVLEQPFDNIAPGFFCPVTVKVGAAGKSWGELEDWNAD